jgi:hypothetical protein
MNVTASASASAGVFPIVVSATSGATVKTATFYLEIFNANFAFKSANSFSRF